MASVILTGSGLHPASHSQTGQIGNTVTASVVVSNTGSADTYVRLAMRGGIQQNGGTYRVSAGASNQTITTTAPLYASAGGKNWSITATLYETNANGDAIRTVGTHPNYNLSIEKPYVPPAPTPWWGADDDDGTGWDDTVGQHPNTSDSGVDFSWDLPWVAPAIPDWILAQEEADDGMY